MTRSTPRTSRRVRLRIWLGVPVLGASLGLVAAALPVIPTPPSPAVPQPTVGDVDLTAGPNTVRAGWTRTTAGAANLVSVRWSGEQDSRFTVETRDSRGRWQIAGELGGERVDEGPDRGTPEYERATRANVSQPLWVGDATSVRVRLEEGTARNVDLVRIQSPRSSPPNGVAGAAVIPVPRIFSRAEWGANENLRLANCPEGPTMTDNVKLAVVHHTAGSNNYGPQDTAAIVRGLYAYATQTLRYCDTHYNFFIDRYGQILEGRYGGIDNPVLGAHTTGANWNTVGIALIGNFQNAAPPAPMMESLKALLAWKFARHGVDPTRRVDYTTLTGTDRWPAGTTKSLPAVVGHRDLGFTVDPGNVYPLLPGVQMNVAERILSGGADNLAGWRPETGKPAIGVASAYGLVYAAGGAPSYWARAVWPNWPIVRDMELLPGGTGGYTLDGFGGIHAFGTAPPVRGSAYWPGWDIARDLVLRPGGGGYVLDGFGGVHPFGGAPAVSGGPYWPRNDIARKLAFFSSGLYVLDGFGGVHATGGAPPVRGGPWWQGWDIARDLRPATTGPGGYLLDGFGGIWPLGGAPALGSTPYYGRDVARGLVLRPGGGGYSLQDSGKLTAFGGAPAVSQARSTYPGAEAITTPYVIRSVSIG